MRSAQEFPHGRNIMEKFAFLTGLSSGKIPQRYLWTDAFAVCNYLELYRQTEDERYKQLALRLVDQVHHILGRHRDDDPRVGWISGLDEQEGEQHPTRGGLRIGKPLNERKQTDPFDERLEWERDGQYFHYLTKWMHALYQVSRATGDFTYHRWAVELARAAHAAFTYMPSSSGQKHMYWKMSIDLSYPLVSAMGQHDPLDGLVTYTELQGIIPKDSEKSWRLNLTPEIKELARMGEASSWITGDLLGIGGLLSDAYRIAQYIRENNTGNQVELLARVLKAATRSLEGNETHLIMKAPVDYRLPFREIGLALGLRAVTRLEELFEDNPRVFNDRLSLTAIMKTLMRYAPLGETIENFWLDPAHQESGTWKDHRHINMVMLATSLAPDGYLRFYPRSEAG